MSELEYDLPAGLIATEPARPREAARLLVATNPAVHLTMADLPSVLKGGDLLVMNRSRVLAARLVGARTDTGGGVDGLFLGREPGEHQGERRWRVMLKARRLREGMVVGLVNEAGAGAGASLQLICRAGESEPEAEGGAWLVAVHGAEGAESDAALLQRIGRTPLPPYIRAARKKAGVVIADERDRADYQTVFAGQDSGSVAAPTAGLHLTEGLLLAIDRAGVERAEVSLHVGTGTFKPVECDIVEDHPMHAEWCEIPPTAAAAILRANRQGRRVVAVGTTSARTLESFDDAELAEAERTGVAASKWTRILITPGYQWKHVSALLTNFHLPRSTLMAMVAALVPGGGGTARLREVYTEAVGMGYRFYSYGDGMFVERPLRP